MNYYSALAETAISRAPIHVIMYLHSVELSVNIWVADNGTDDNCNGQISWEERNKDYCTTTI